MWLSEKRTYLVIMSIVYYLYLQFKKFEISVLVWSPTPTVHTKFHENQSSGWKVLTGRQVHAHSIIISTKVHPTPHLRKGTGGINCVTWHNMHFSLHECELINNFKISKNMQRTEHRSVSVTHATQNAGHRSRMRALLCSERRKPHIRNLISRLCTCNITRLYRCRLTDVTSQSSITSRRAREPLSFPSFLPQSLNKR
jgi:hypothetical protein